MKFRKRPIEVDAIRWNGDGLDFERWICSSMPPGMREKGPSWEIERPTEYLRIKTLEGVSRCEVGDWIVIGVQGEIYPIKDAIFRATYDEV